MTKRMFSIFPLFLAFLAAAGCDKNNETGPSPITTPTPIATPTPVPEVSITVRGLETGMPVSNGTVTARGEQPVNIINGTAAVRESAARSGLTIEVPGHITRNTKYDGGSEFTVMANIDETMLRAMVYGSGTFGRIRRPIGLCMLIPEGDIRNDQAARDTLETAATAMTDATQGRIPFSVSDNPVGSCIIRVRINPNMPLGRGAQLAEHTYAGDTFTGGTIEVRNIFVARSTMFITHECGHAYGLDHNPGSGLMSPSPNGSDFTPDEKRLMFFMANRRPGTKPLDDDR